MKALVYFLVVLASSMTASAQTNDAPGTRTKSRNYFYTSPIQLSVSQLLISYERDIGDKHGIAFLPGIILSGATYDYVSFGITQELQYRYHVLELSRPKTGDKIKFRFDVYMAPFIQYQYLEYESDYYDYYTYSYDPTYTYKGYFNAVSGGILFGAKITFLERFSIDHYFGGGIKYSDHTLDDRFDNGAFFAGYRGIIGKGNFQLGIAF